jgi:transposase
MRDREVKKQALLELIKKDPEAVVELLLDLMERVEVLEQKLAKNSRNSSKPPSSDGYNKPQPKSLRKQGRRKSGGQPGHPGKTLEFSKDPDRITKHTLLHCPISGDSFTEKDIVNIIKRQVFDLPEPKLVIEEHWIYQYRDSSGHIVTAEVPEGVNAAVQYGKRFQSWLVYLNDYQLVPLNRIRQICADLYGYWISEDTILRARQQCYEQLEGFERQVKEILGNCAIAHADETGLKINSKNHWLHTLCNGRYTFLGIHPKRGYQALEEFGILERFRGRLVHDCWSAYFRLNNCEHSLCNPHLIGELVFAEEQLDQAWAKKMKQLLEDAYDFSKASKGEVVTNSKPGWHIRYGRIIAEGHRENPHFDDPPGAKKKRGRPKKTKSRNLLERMDKYRDQILAFIWDPEIPFSNNQAEQDIRMVKVKQKISGGFRTLQNAEIFARIRSYISTERKQGVRAWKALAKAFENPHLGGFAARKQIPISSVKFLSVTKQQFRQLLKLSLQHRLIKVSIPLIHSRNLFQRFRAFFIFIKNFGGFQLRNNLSNVPINV